MKHIRYYTNPENILEFRASRKPVSGIERMSFSEIEDMLRKSDFDPIPHYDSSEILDRLRHYKYGKLMSLLKLYHNKSWFTSNGIIYICVSPSDYSRADIYELSFEPKMDGAVKDIIVVRISPAGATTSLYAKNNLREVCSTIEKQLFPN